MLKETSFIGFCDQETYPKVHRYLMASQVDRKDVIEEGVNNIFVAFARNGIAPIMFHLHPKDTQCDNHDEATHRYFVDTQDDAYESVRVIDE